MRVSYLLKPKLTESKGRKKIKELQLVKLQFFVKTLDKLNSLCCSGHNYESIDIGFIKIGSVV